MTESKLSCSAGLAMLHWVILAKHFTLLVVGPSSFASLSHPILSPNSLSQRLTLRLGLPQTHPSEAASQAQAGSGRWLLGQL